MLAIGVDIVAISRMRETIGRSGSIFIDRVFTDREKKDSLAHPDRAVYFAEVFAAKEAVFKTFSIGWTDEMSFLDIELQKGFYGEPLVCVKGAFSRLLSLKNAGRILVSLSWERDAAIAFATMERPETSEMR